MNPATYAIVECLSDDEELLAILNEPSKPNLLSDVGVDDDSDEDNFVDMTTIIHPVIDGMQRIDRIKILNYIENTVHLYTDRDFLMHFRLSRQLTYDLIARFAESEFYMNLVQSSKSEPITAEKHILSFLWFVGHSACYRDVADRFNVTLSTLFAIITRVTEFFLRMGPDVIKLPNEDERKITRDYFFNKNKFPNIIGAIDGSHIEIDKPKKDPDSYYTRKKRFAFHVQGLVDHRSKFLHVFVGYPASVHDARVFKETELIRLLPGICTNDTFILADSAYPLMKEVMVPYRDNGHLTRKHKKFNRILSSCRIVVEHAFGNLKQRFRQMYHIKLHKKERIVKLIFVCCILHNLADANDLTIFEPAPVEHVEDENGGDEDVEFEFVYDNAVIRQRRDDLRDVIWNS